LRSSFLRCLRSLRGGQLRGALYVLPVLAGVGFALAGDSIEAQEGYSAYADPERPALSLVLSKDENVEDFQTTFALGDAKVEEARAAVLRENEALAVASAESEQIVEANEGLPPEEIEEKIAASDYHEKVRAAIAETKSTIESLLPEDRRSELGPWVDAKIDQETQAAAEIQVSGKGRGVVCRVYATQYNGYTRSEVALPHKSLKLRGGYTVSIRRGNHDTKARVKEVGPWNIQDNYWQSPRKRDMWGNLRRCTPEAQAAYFDNFNRGRDQFGRKVLNPAGVDLTPRVASRLGLKRYQNAWVYVRFPWVGR
jgi:hypothetical protein